MVGFVQLSLFAACEPYSEERLSKARELGALLASKMAFDVTMRSGLIVDLDEDLPAKGDFAVQAFDSQISIDEAAVKERELDELPAVQLELPEAVDGKKGKRPFNLFFIDTRPLILKELEGLDAHIDDVDPALRDVAIAYREDNSLKVNCLVSKIIGQRWRNLTDQEQMVYKNRADYVNKKAQAKRNHLIKNSAISTDQKHMHRRRRACGNQNRRNRSQQHFNMPIRRAKLQCFVKLHLLRGRC